MNDAAAPACLMKERREMFVLMFEGYSKVDRRSKRPSNFMQLKP
jgi:hypothetical protein